MQEAEELRRETMNCEEWAKEVEICQQAEVRIAADREDLAAQSAERIRIQQALVAAGGDRKMAANRLGLSRGDLLNRLMSLGIR